MSQKTIPVSYGKNGKRLTGGAAQLHFIKQNGGFDSFVEKIAIKAARNTILELERDANKQNFRIVQ